MANELMKAADLETVLERTTKKMDAESSYLLEFWKYNDSPFLVRVNMEDSFCHKYSGYFEALCDVGLFDDDDLKAARTYLETFSSILLDSAYGCV